MLSKEEILKRVWFEDQDTGDMYYFNGEQWVGENEHICTLLIEYRAIDDPRQATTLIAREIGAELSEVHDMMKRF